MKNIEVHGELKKGFLISDNRFHECFEIRIEKEFTFTQF